MLFAFEDERAAPTLGPAEGCGVGVDDATVKLSTRMRSTPSFAARNNYPAALPVP
jgi:hypothetical protein